MRTIVIGDIHGRYIWKEIISKEEANADRIVFIGDYFDTKEDISATYQMFNFNEIINYKKENLDKVILLFGNHDFHYLINAQSRYTGFQAVNCHDISDAIHKALDDHLLQMSYVNNDIIFTHAGVSKTWCRNILETDNFIGKGSDLEYSLNEIFKYQPNAFEFTSGELMDKYGDEVCQTPIWIRPDSLLVDKLDGFKQVVGHTSEDDIIIQDGVAFIDCLYPNSEYLIIEDGVMSIGKI